MGEIPQMCGGSHTQKTGNLKKCMSRSLSKGQRAAGGPKKSLFFGFIWKKVGNLIVMRQGGRDKKKGKEKKARCVERGKKVLTGEGMVPNKENEKN